MFNTVLVKIAAPSFNKITVLATAALAPVVAFINQYVFNDWGFIVSLAVFVALDSAIGFVAAIKNKRLNSSKMGTLVPKVLQYAALLIVTHGLTYFKVHGESNVLFKAVDYATYSYIMAREALSIIENITMIDPKFAPKWLRERLQQVIDTGTTSFATAATASVTTDENTGATTATATVTTIPEPAPVEAAGNIPNPTT